jgi:hypothetical protein
MAITQKDILTFLLALIVGATVFAPSRNIFAQPATKKKKSKDSGQPAIVIVDGAAIYEKSNFDSPVMDYLERGKKVLISRKVYRGAGGLGAFYKIKIRKGIFGYVTDVDVQLDKANKNTDESEKPDENDPTQIQSNLENPDPADDDGGDTVYLTRFLGLGMSQFNYAETIANKKKSSATSMIAFKMSGPGKVMGGLPLDYEFSFTTSAPDFYDVPFSSAKGFLLLGHVMTILPLAQFKKSMFYYGFGLAAKFHKFDVVMRNNSNKTPVDSQDFAAGVALQLGYVYAFTPRYCLRLDGKYYYEAEQYFGYGAALQMKY